MTRKMRTKNANAIVASLELASERLGDLTPHVYAALFAEYPEMKPLYVPAETVQVQGVVIGVMRRY